MFSAVKVHLLDVRDKLGKYDLDHADLKKLNPLYWKRSSNGVVDKETGPSLYVRLAQEWKKDVAQLVVTTDLYDITRNSPNEEENKFKLEEVLDKYCFVYAVIRIESIYIGSKISVIFKLDEGAYEFSFSYDLSTLTLF